MDATEIIEVDRILAHRTVKSGAVSYLVLWKGFGIKDSSWEPEAHLEGCEQVVSDYLRHPRPNVTKAQIMQEAKQKREEVQSLPAKRQEYLTPAQMAESVRKRATPTAPDFNKTFDVLDHTPLTHRTHSPLVQDKAAERTFDWRAFLKLGLSVSAVIILVFLLFNGGDELYIRRYLEKQTSAGS